MTQQPVDISRENYIPQESTESLQVEVASQWKLMWWKFRKHKLAMVSGALLIIFYTVALFCEFFAPKLSGSYKQLYVYAPPQQIHFIRNGKLQLYVYGYTFIMDPESYKKTWTVDKSTIIPIGFFVKGETYKLWDLIPSKIHFFGPTNANSPFYLLGSDKSGRDVFSRIIYSSRISLSVGLVGVVISFTIGVLIGGISGLVGGWIDNIIQRVIEILISIPTLPIWLAFAAIVPINWSPLRVYFIISLILTIVGWTGMARVVRSKFLSLREEDFILAARLDGCNQWRLVTRHMIPSFLSHLIAQLTLWIPGMILGETGLSFLGVGLRPPIVSWGVMLKDCQKVAEISLHPWMLMPAVAVIVVVLSLNFLGDGLRDAADPYQ